MANGIDWTFVLEKIKEAKDFFDSEGINPTLRTVFYRLVSQEVIPNTTNYYKTLSRKIVQAKKESVIDWSFLEDHVRYSFDNLSDSYITDDEVEDVRESCDSKLEDIDLDIIINEFFDWTAPSKRPDYWAKQSIIPEIWIEKDALAHTIKKWLQWNGHYKDVSIRVNRGYASWGFIRDCALKLQSILKTHKKVVILYLGDLDPSGVDIQRALEDSLKYFDLDVSKVEMKRLALTPDQIDEYSLPPRPEDAETLAKLERDSRKENYEHEYICELDALLAFVPKEFKKMIKEGVDEYFDRDSYDKVKSEQKEIYKECKRIIEDYKNKAKQKIRDQM